MESLSVNPQDLPSTHASRHPDKPIIPPRKDYLKKSRAERETAAVGKALKREKKEALQNEINAFWTYQEKCAVDIAEKYSMDVQKARGLLNNGFVMKHNRKTSTFNALVHSRGKELNEGRAKGERMNLKEIRKIVQDELDDGKYNDVDLEELCEELQEAREVKAKGARSSNKAATADYNLTTQRIEKELANLHERCGTMGFMFTTRGHVHDTIIPGWIEAPQGSLKFLSDVLNITKVEFLAKFEQWACAQDRTKKINTIGDLRTESCTMIVGGLRAIVGIANLTMCFEKYETNIVEKYGVHLRGWPKGLKRQSPAKITNMEDARALHTALTSGECKWVKLTREEKEAWAQKKKDQIESGEVISRKRKKRSDAGKKRGPRKSGEKRPRGEEQVGSDADDSEEENCTQPKKKRATKAAVLRKLPPVPKSREVLSTSESGSDDDS